MIQRVQRWLTHPRTVLVCQIVLGLVFAAAALAKLGDLRSFATQVHNFRLVPVPTENLLAMTLPWMELLAALALLLRVQPRAGALTTAGMMAIFCVVVLAAVARGLDIDCGCFGTSDGSRVGMKKLLENLGLLVLALIASLKPQKGTGSFSY